MGGEPRVCVYQVFPCVKNGAYPASIPCLTAGKWRGMPGAAIPSPGETSIPLPEAPNPEAGACRCTNPANNFAAFSITPHSPGLRPLPKQQQAPLAVSSLDPMAQGHTVLPPYGSGLGRERAVFPRYYRSRPFSFYQCTESCDCQSTARTRGAVARPAGTAVRGWSERTAHCTN